MLQDTKVKEIQVLVSQPEEEQQFSEEFLRMMQDYAYEILRAYLERTQQKDAVKLLDDLIILSMPRQQASACLYNQMLSEVVGGVSHHILPLGGRFYSSAEITAPFEPQYK